MVTKWPTANKPLINGSTADIVLSNKVSIKFVIHVEQAGTLPVNMSGRHQYLTTRECSQVINPVANVVKGHFVLGSVSELRIIRSDLFWLYRININCIKPTLAV